MSKYKRRKLGAFILVFALMWGIMEPAARLGAETSAQDGNQTTVGTGETPTGAATGSAAGVATGSAAGATTEPTTKPTATPEVVEITAFSGHSKYFGQKRSFLQDVHYSLPEGETLDEGVTLALESEEVGEQKFIVVDNRSQEKKDEKIYKIKNANEVLYKIKPYYVPADVKIDDQKLNCKDRESLDEKDTITLTAPNGYLVSTGPSADIKWQDVAWEKELKVVLPEKDQVNEISYYLSSQQEDTTRNAIDQTKKKVNITVDWTPPVITSLNGETGSDVSAVGHIVGTEAGKYYYIVLPEQVAKEEEERTDAEGNKVGITAEFIKNRVASHYGIVGYGRVDAEKESSFSFNGLMAETDYQIYSFMEDNAGNESKVFKSDSFTTEKIALAGTVEITGTLALDETVEAKVNMDSASPGDISYQWYRIKNKEDDASLDEVWDETGGADADDLEAEIDDEDDDEDDDDTYELEKVRKLAESDADDVTVISDGAVAIPGATGPTYKITKDDIGHRLICKVEATNYSGYIAGESTTFVPKLIPQVTLPVIASAVYSPKRTLASIQLPERWSWVDNTIVPVYGNSGYRAKFVPENTTMYRSVIVRIKVPVTKKSLAKKMLTLKKTHAYTGKAIKDNFYLEDGDDELVSGRDYRATYRNNKKLGKAYITIKGIGNYKGTIRANYKIVACSVKSLKYQYSKKKVYTGKARTAGVVIKNGSVKLKKNKDYTIRYKNNKKIGKATITIRGKGNYKGKKTLHFQIVPSKPKIVKVTKKKASFRLQFSKSKQVSGYRVFVSTSKSFSKKKTQEYVTTGNRFGMYSLQAGTYYVRIKSYGSKKGKSYESSYSSSRKIKIKK